MTVGVFHINTQEEAQAELERQRRMAREREARRKERLAADQDAYHRKKQTSI